MVTNLLLSAFLAVLTAIGGTLAIPLPIPLPFTMQTFVVITSGLLLGKKYGPVSQSFYIVMGLIGLPVFAKGTGGIHHLFSPTFGFLLGFIAASWTAGALGRDAKTASQYIAVSCLSALSLYLIALPYFYFYMNFITGTTIHFSKAFQLIMLPFLIPDTIKAIAAGLLAHRLIPLLKDAGLLPIR